MVVGEAINNIMGGIENTGTVKQHNHKKKLRQRFDIIKKLGQGTFGKVQLGINKETGQEVAIKTIKKSKIESEADLVRIRREIQIMSSVQHPNIIHIYEGLKRETLRKKWLSLLNRSVENKLCHSRILKTQTNNKLLKFGQKTNKLFGILFSLFWCSNLLSTPVHPPNLAPCSLKRKEMVFENSPYNLRRRNHLLGKKTPVPGNGKTTPAQNIFHIMKDNLGEAAAGGNTSFVQVFENREKMVLVMEYAAGGELYDYLSERKVLDQEEARRIFRQIATACYYCHKHKICHRDLKLENILLDENNNAKIADFGLSNVFDDQRLLNTFCGSPLYASPEIVKGTPYQGPEVDCWSLGVLLYTLVYGAMPFDGSNFKRLVKQISQGDYFEPAKPSPASPLIRDMLTVNPKMRADIEKICTHWWVNEGYSDSCLDISEELANQTPVRLDVLLSLAPPPPQLESEKLMLTGEDQTPKVESIAPTRSQSVGSFMELSHPAERRINDLINEDKINPKRKLETTVSTDQANLDKRKDKIIKENTVADITVHGGTESLPLEDAKMSNSIPLNKSSTQTLSRDMDIEQNEVMVDPSLEGAVCSEILEEAERRKPQKLKKTSSTSLSTTVLEGINEIPSQENVADTLGKENVKEVIQETKMEERRALADGKTQNKKKIVKKKVLTDKDENTKETACHVKEANVPKEEKQGQQSVSEVPSKPIERRKSRIFEAAEKFQSMISPTEPKPDPIEKPKKIVIPGVSVDGFKKEFERKASLTSTSSPKLKCALSKRFVPEKKSDENEATEQKVVKVSELEPIKIEEDIKERVRNAVSIISSALDKEGTRKSKSRPCMMRKPPVPFGVSGRSASGNIGMLTSPLSPLAGPKPFRKHKFDQVEVKRVGDKTEPTDESKISSAEITLKSATLPRRKTTKAEIQLNYPVPKPAPMGFKTEMAHNINAYPIPASQKTEVIVPVSSTPSSGFRATSLEQDRLVKGISKERIIPISFEKQENGKENVQSPPVKPPTARFFQTQRSDSSQKNNLSRQSTQDSDTETLASTGEPIKKSPREYIIPIAVEGGGYVTPRAGSLEPSETASTTSTMTNKSKTKFGRVRRMNSLFSDRDSEDESSPFSTLHRHGSIGKDSDNDDSKKDVFHLHRLRSTRPTKTNLEHADSLSSGEEDDDEGFEILTAENLFSTLLSRVRDLTQRLNVDDGVRPGFPSSRLLSHFDHGTNFWNRMEHPLSRHSSLGRTFNRDRPITKTSTGSSFGVPWRRSVSKDLASDIDSVFKNAHTGAPRPTGDVSKNENLNLPDLDLKTFGLTEEDALALSYLTPGLSRRIQKQIFAQLAPSEARKLHRTLSSRTSEEQCLGSKISPSFTSTLPRRFSVENNSGTASKSEIDGPKESNLRMPKSFLPIKRDEYKPSYEFNIRSSSIGAEPRCDNKFSYRKPKITKSFSVREPRSYSLTKTDMQSPESSISESFSNSNRNDSLESSSKCISDSSVSRPYSKYSSDSSYSRYSPNKSSQSLLATDIHKTDLKKPSNPRKVSRFLRPDFFDTPKEDSIFLKEKKEREMETQKVLKEIRDKRKGILSSRRDQPGSRDKQLENESIQINFDQSKENIVRETKSLLSNVTDGIKSLESNVPSVHDYVNVSVPIKNCPIQSDNQSNEFSSPSKSLHDYVNVKTAQNSVPAVKKEKSRIARPKSYPTENVEEKKNYACDKESKISKLRKGFSRQSKDKSKECKNEANKCINDEEKGQKNKLLQSIERKLEKFRSTKDPEEIKAMQEKKSSVENAIKRLREQSLPRNLEHCTESGLIKRAVSVEDLSGIKPLQASRKSVTKILGLFKKYEEQDKKKITKKIKNKSNKPGDKERDRTTESVIQKIDTGEVNSKCDENGVPPNDTSQSETSDKNGRPRSLLFDKMKQFRNCAKSDTVLNENGSKVKSKLPVNSFRRSLNLDNLPEPPKFYKNPSKSNLTEGVDKKAERKHLKLELGVIPSKNGPAIVMDSAPSTSIHCEENSSENRNSLTTTDDSSTMLSPSDDYMSCDSWSVCSDFHHMNDLHSPLSPNSHIYSGDENESVIDRIRRKSFYTRFNEKKRTRKPSSYKDLDLGYKSPADYSSIDRKSYDYRNPVTCRSSYASTLQEPSKTNRSYNRSSSLMSDFVNMPNRYQTYSSKIGRPVSSLYSEDSEDNALDDLLSTANSRKYSSHIQASRLARASASPVNEYFIDHPSSSIVPPTSSEPV